MNEIKTAISKPIDSNQLANYHKTTNELRNREDRGTT